MTTTLYNRTHGFSVATDAAVGRTLARVKECLAKAGVASAPLRFCFHGSRGCAEIVARFPKLRRFLSSEGPQYGAAPDEHLSNFGPSAPGALAGPLGDVEFETILAIAEGIPTKFPISNMIFVIGPILEETAAIALSSQHRPLRDITTLCAQCVTLMWQSVAPRNGQRYSLVVFEALPTDDATQLVPAWVQALYSAFPGSAEKITSDIDLKTLEYRMVVTWPDKSFVGSKSIGDDLKLPHQLRDPRAAAELKYVPVKRARSLIEGVFADDGWKRTSDRKQARVYELWKPSAAGRRLRLTFRIQSSRPSSRSILCIMGLISERGRVNVTVLAERSARREYEIPNPQTFREVLENMRVVVKHLEDTWVAEVEEALGPVPPNYKPSDE
jgi:hypothetical protein